MSSGSNRNIASLIHGHPFRGHQPEKNPERPILLGVIFSKDRPLQLEALLSSLALHCQDAPSLLLKVIYKTSNWRQQSLYRHLMSEHPEVIFIREHDFRADTLGLLTGADHVLLLVDDTVFIRNFTASTLVEALDQRPEAVGLSLRLGRNTTYCYSLDRAQPLPQLEPIGPALFMFRWTDAEGDFGYPLEVSSSIYRTANLLPLLTQSAFNNPNTLEAHLAEQATHYRASKPFLICPIDSLAFSAPLNKVQSVCNNRAGAKMEYSPGALAWLFAEGQRVNVGAFLDFVPRACHQEVELTLVRIGPSIPLISVVIPCYNQANFLAEAIESVIAQTFTDWEIIIVNDGSPDNTSEVAEALLRKYPHSPIRLMKQANGGLAEARNAGIRTARGAFILPLDADDKIEPALLEKAFALLESEPDTAIAYTDVTHFGSAARTIQAAEYDFSLLCENNQLNYCSLYPREAWEQVGGYNANMVWGYEDWEFWIGCGELGFRGQRIPEPLLLYRVKESSMYTKALQHDEELRARIVMNHPALYDRHQCQQAQRLVAKAKFPLPPGAPVVSVIVPTSNRPAMLREALLSVLKQTLQDFELIVINDGGVDVEHVIRSLGAEPKIKHLRHSAKRGPSASRNSGLRLARGKYIAYLDDDDIFYPQHLETLVRFAESGGHAVVYSDADCAMQTPVAGGYVTTEREIRYSNDFDPDLILSQNLLPVLCLLHERRCVEQVGSFDEGLQTHEDWELWIRMSRHYPFVHLKEVTCEFRLREDGSSATSSNRADFLRTARLICNKYKAYSAGKPDVLLAQSQLLLEISQSLEKDGVPNDRPGPLKTLWNATVHRLFHSCRG